MYNLLQKCERIIAPESASLKHYYCYLPLILTFIFFVVLLYRYAVGFYIIDDWAYVLSFQYLAIGDYKALWAVVCEHRPILAKTFHYLSYIYGYDGKLLVLLSQFCRLLTAIFLVKHISEELDFPNTRFGLALKMAAVTAAALVLFSPVQAWAIARSTYIETYACVFGAILVISGAIRINWWMISFGLFISMVSTPGWMVLLPLFVVIFIFYSVFKYNKNRKQILISSGVIIIILILFYILNQLPFSHPNDHIACSHPKMDKMVKLIFSDTNLIVSNYIAHLGFSMGWVPWVCKSESSASYETTFLSAYIAGVIFLLCTIYFLWDFLKHKRGSRVAIFVLLWTLIMGAAITLSRAVVMGDMFVVNYCYPVYITPGWATLLFLVIQRASIRPSNQYNGFAWRAKSVFIIVIVFICILFSYPKGCKELKGTMNGMRYMQALYRDGFIESSVASDRKYDIAKTIYAAFPDKIYDGTVMLENLRGFPDAWKK